MFFLFWVNMAALCHMTRNVKFLNTMRRLWPRPNLLQIDYLLSGTWVVAMIIVFFPNWLYLTCLTYPHDWLLLRLLHLRVVFDCLPWAS
jgi:hypothetical protein